MECSEGTQLLNLATGTVLLTGATGYIGAHLLDALSRGGYDVKLLLRKKSAACRFPGATFHFGDLTDATSLEGIEKNINIVLHCAGMLGKWGMPEDRIREVNVNGVINLMNRFRGQTLHRFIHLSAGGVTGPVPGLTSVDETYKCHPATSYERTKFEGEQEVLSAFGNRGLPAVVVRPTFTYGPGDPHKLGLFKAINKGRFLFINGGKSVNHPVFIDDAIAGILLAMQAGRPGEVYIIGGSRPVTKRELAYTIADALEVSRPRINIPRWVAQSGAFVLEAAGRIAHFEPMLTGSRVVMMSENFGYSIAKAQNELGYNPQVSLQEGIQLTADSYVATKAL
jgi:dihydroflavonol-4-reductase